MTAAVGLPDIEIDSVMQIGRHYSLKTDLATGSEWRLLTIF